MAKVLKVNAASGDTDSYAVADLGGDHADVWVTLRVYYPAASLAGILAHLGSIWLTMLRNAADTDNAAAAGTGSGTWATFDDNGTVPQDDSWAIVEYHQVNGGTSDLYVDGSLMVDGADSSGVDTGLVRVGFISGGATGVSPSVFYVDNVTVGTTRGGSDLFSDDFESGNLLAWAATVGDVLVIDDPLVSPFAGATKISIAFADGPLVVSPTWTRIDDLDGVSVTQWDIARGRPTELDKTGTGTTTINLIDRDGIFDPTNFSSPYFGDVEPDKQIMIELYDPVHDEYQTRFRGFVEQLDFTLGQPLRQWVEVQISCVDGFAWLNDHMLEPGDGDTPPAGSEGNVFYEDTAGSVDDRILAILADVGWPSGLQSIFSGNVKVQETVYAPGTEALAALFDAADAEFPGVANLYMDREGILIFHGRQARFRPNVAQYAIRKQDVGDPSVTAVDPTICPISEISFELGKGSLFNSVSALPQGIAETDVAGQLSEDATSIGAHGKKSLSFTDLLTLEGNATSNTALQETFLFAQYYKDNYKDPLPRINRLVFKTRDPHHRLAGPLWRMMCRSDISDLLTVYTTHPSASGFVGAGYYIEGIRQTCTPAGPDFANVVLELDVSPQALYNTNPFDADVDPS